MFAKAARQLKVLARDPVLLALIVVIFTAVAIFVVYPIVKVLIASLQVGGEWSTDTFAQLGQRRLYRSAIINSLSVGALVGILGVVIGYIAAFVLTRLDVPGRRILHYLTMLPIISPPFVSAVSILFLFGLSRGGLDFAGFGPSTWVALGAFWLGKPLGIMAVALILRAMSRPLPNRLDLRDLAYIAGLMGIGFTLPLITLETALPGGQMQEAARIGLGLTLLAGPALVLLARLRPPHPRAGGKPARH